MMVKKSIINRILIIGVWNISELRHFSWIYMYLLLFEIFFSLGPFCWRVLSDCVIMELEPRDMPGWCLHSDRPTWEMIWKIFFSFDFHILPQQRHIGDRIFPCCCILKKKKEWFSMRSMLTHLLTIYETVSKLLDCGRENQNYIHIDTYYCKPEL